MAKQSPGRIAEALEPFCERLLSAGDRVFDPGELQAGFWIDKLAIALTRLERWDDAARWLQRYFDLPDGYRRRDSASELQAMRRRLDRSLRNISRGK